MTIPKIPQEAIGKWYLFGFVFVILGLAMNDWPAFMIIGALSLIWTFYSDDYDTNHVDPEGTVYVNDKGETYTNSHPKQEDIP